MPSKLEYYVFPRLKTAKREVDDGFKSYKSGASFSGHLQEGIIKAGHGVFVWPNGDRYKGDFVDNVRTGTGVQDWADGSKYDGKFERDMRHGDGKMEWIDGEGYNGGYFKDKRHGVGTYTWPDGTTYTGTFYCDKKEGYGTFTLSTGERFEGLYRNDERDGPGIQTYQDGSQDVGLWHRERLVKLCRATEDAFTMKDHPEFDYNSEEHIKQIYVTQELNKKKPNCIGDEFAINDLRQELKKINEMSDFTSFQPSSGDSIDMNTLTYDKREYDQVFFNDNCDDEEENCVITALNNTPSFMNIQTHMYKHRRRQSSMSFDVQKLLVGDRSGFAVEGPIEIASEKFIKAAGKGDLKTVYNLLTNGDVDVDVADQCGNTALLAAAVNMNNDVINCLLDHGADVNKLNDEGISALAACHVFFYPISSFRHNTAETYLNKVAEDNDVTEMPEDDKVDDALKESAKKKEEIKSDEKENELDLQSVVVDDTEVEDFESNISLRNLEIEVTEQLLERTATALSTNKRVISARMSIDLGLARTMAVNKADHVNMESTIRLLLRRGADPNASCVPMAVVFFAIKAADVEAVQVLLEKGAATTFRLSEEKGGLTPLNIASAIPGDEGVQITKLLLEAGADPNSRAQEEDIPEDDDISPSSMGMRVKSGLDDSVSLLSMELEERGDNIGGRTALHIACQRDDNHKLAQQVVRLLLEHGANPNVLCKGQSPLSLAIGSGNDLAIDELLCHGANPSLPLGHGVGSALCASSNTAFEHRRTPEQRIALIDKLIEAGANILAPIAVGSKRSLGTAVDYAYWMFNQDRRIAHMPYHALTHSERDTYNARRKLLAHMGDLLREAAVNREQRRLEQEEYDGRRSTSPSPNFVYTGAGAKVPESVMKPKSRKSRRLTSGEDGRRLTSGEDGKQVVFHSIAKDSHGQEYPLLDRNDDIYVRKPLFKYCYECGRSIGVRLSACTRCKEVYYCSKACKLKAWNARHKEECVRIGGRSRSPSPSGKSRGAPGRIDSPTPTTNASTQSKVTVDSLMGNATVYSLGSKAKKGVNKGNVGGKQGGKGSGGQYRGGKGPGGQYMGGKGPGGQYMGSKLGGKGPGGQYIGTRNKGGDKNVNKGMEDNLSGYDGPENYSFN
uniref:Ankyrin repeat and MYND domain-containing protein 1-like n=1 Tax=Saccoglossus kowalevskii TaxID=10224 RepID=A0ABM0GMX1_SACKO|nr:PREDICTED: ankyrin repeat and MYND domain-containing protein 1-like [Saccoglossus kowalevskii]